MIFKARNAATGEGALVRVYGKDTDLLLDRRYVVFFTGSASVFVCVVIPSRTPGNRALTLRTRSLFPPWCAGCRAPRSHLLGRMKD